jgi:hypothetical protein
MRLLSSTFVLLILFCGCFTGHRAEAALPNLYISDDFNVDVFNGSSLNSNFISINQAGGLAFGSNGTLYAASMDDSQIYSYNPTTGTQTGTFVSFFGSGDSRSVQGPTGMAWGSDGNLYVADVTASNVHLYSSLGVSLSSIGGSSLDQPVNVAFNQGGQLFAVDNFGIERYNGSQFVSDIPVISGGGSYVLNAPSSVAFSPAGDTYVLDISGASAGILKFTGSTFDSEVVNFTTTDFTPADLIIGPDNKLYVSGFDAINGGEVLDFNLNGSGESVYASGLNNPTYMAFAAPEPSTALLVFAGLGLAGLRRSRPRAV